MFFGRLKNLIIKAYYDQKIRFLFVGGLNTLVGVGVTCIVYLLFGLPMFKRENIPFVPMLVGTLSGQIIGTVHSYFWNKYFTFRSKEKSGTEFLRFVLVYIVQYLLSLGLTALFNMWISIPLVVTVVTVFVCTVLSYFGHKYFSFGKANKEKRTMRVSDYIADFLVKNGVNRLFTVTGGGAMFLNDSFGHKEGLSVTYNHHEQACAVAAEGYARETGKPAAVCVTTGPGGTNALTGVLGSWTDSIPMIVISGQVKFITTVASCPELPLRQLGDQEFHIVDCAKTMTKYAVMVTDPLKIRYHLEKAFYLAVNGRPGPVWLDIPINIQSAQIDTAKLIGYDKKENCGELPTKPEKEIYTELFEKISSAKRPVILAGEGIRISGTEKEFIKFAEKLNIPVCLAWNANDLLGDDHPLNCGRPGTVGTRGGNFVLQSADLVLSLGCRMNIRQISYNWENFAKNATLIAVDIDKAELDKPTLKVDMKIHADLKDFLPAANRVKYTPRHDAWLTWAKKTAFLFPADLPKYYEKTSPVNPYVFMKKLGTLISDDERIVMANATACVCLYQAMDIKKGQRLFTNSGMASMGYGLPAAIGACFADIDKRLICIEGDGSIQMNLQELQTVVTNRLPLKIIWLNNQGYHSIRQTQTNVFKANFCGVGEGDGVSFPSAEKIAGAYGIDFFKIEDSAEIEEKVDKWLDGKNPAILEVVLDKTQFFEPKLSSKTLPDGTIVSPSLEDMYPFLDDADKPALPEELK